MLEKWHSDVTHFYSSMNQRGQTEVVCVLLPVPATQCTSSFIYFLISPSLRTSQISPSPSSSFLPLLPLPHHKGSPLASVSFSTFEGIDAL